MIINLIPYISRQIMLLLSLLTAKRLFSERIAYPARLKAIGLILALAITAAVLIEEAGAYILIRKKDDPSPSLLLRSALLELACFCLIIFTAFLAIKRFADMPISTVFLIVISIAAGFCHQMISFFFGWTREKLFLKGMFCEED